MSTEVLTQFIRVGDKNYYIVQDTDVQGGFQVVATLSDRDNILPNLRKIGMRSYVVANDTTYKLESDLTTWTIDSGGGVGRDFKDSAEWASTANLPLNGLAAIDGPTSLTVGDRVLVKNQTTSSQNGIYVAAAGPWARAADANTNGQLVNGTVIFVVAGAANSGTGWIITSPDPITIGTSAIIFSNLPNINLADNSSSGLQPHLAGVAGAVPRDNGDGTETCARLTFDDIDPAFSITAFNPSGFSSPRELGNDLVNPAFAAAYNASLSALTVNDGGGPLAISLSAESSFGYNNGGGSGLAPATYHNTLTLNNTVNWALVATKVGGAPSFTKNLSINNGAGHRYFDTAVQPGSYNAAFIATLVGNETCTGFARNNTVYASGASTKRCYYVYPTAYGDPSSIKDSNGFTFPMSKVAFAVAFTNGFGALIPGGMTILESAITIAAFTVTFS